MANIAKLPDGVALATAQTDGSVVAYGPHCSTRRTANVATLLRKDGVALAEVASSGHITMVGFTNLDPVTVPYVNRFLAGTT